MEAESMGKSPEVVFNALDRTADAAVSHRNLPPWFQVGVALFITFHAQDAIPHDVVMRMKQELEEWLSATELPKELASSFFDAKARNRERHFEAIGVLDRKEFRKRTDRLLHDALDECYGKCQLKCPDLARIVADTILYHNSSKYDLDCFVVMPNHVHAIVQFKVDGGLKLVGQSWMRYSARLINQHYGASGPFWQAAPIEHVIGSAEQFVYLQQYLAGNPAKANLRSSECLLWERERE
jgi:putative transposase